MPRSKVGKALTKVRGPVHGNFAEGATITQGVLALFQGGSSWPKMSAAKKEAIHMIVHKLHRIVTGNPDHRDHWDDIGGYGQLGADDCTDVVPAKRRYKKRKVKTAKKQVAVRPAKKAATRERVPGPTILAPRKKRPVVKKRKYVRRAPAEAA